MWASPDEVIDFEADEDSIEYFTLKQCGALAYEIYKLRNWSLAMLSSDNYGNHIFIIDSDGMAIDIRGRRKLEDVKDEWYFCNNLHRFFTIDEFKKEMTSWKMNPPFNKDRRAKLWAKRIVDLL